MAPGYFTLALPLKTEGGLLMLKTFKQNQVMQFPAFDPEMGQVVLEPAAPGQGHWVGCPSVFYDAERESYLLTYRRRRPRGLGEERGYACFIAESKDGLSFEEIWSVKKSQLNSSSMERFCIQKSPEGTYLLYISYVDPSDNRWRIDVIEADRPDNFDVTQRQEVFTAAGTQTEAVKDPHVIKVGPVYYMLVSYAKKLDLTASQSAQAHSTGDIYTTGMTQAPTALAQSLDGIHFNWLGEILPVGSGWDRYQSRLNSLVKLGDLFLGFYDGSASEKENYEERCGLAVSFDLKNWDKLTPEQPWVVSPYSSGSLRYVEALKVGQELWLYYEYARQDAAHELRLIKLAV
jgi:hypothetical protein